MKLKIDDRKDGMVRLASLDGSPVTDWIQEEDASDILKAVNSHDDLVAALKAWIEAYGWTEVTGSMRDLREMSKAALAKAKG